jgi:glycerol-3-phosphate dehydrogenase (NAD+)
MKHTPAVSGSVTSPRWRLLLCESPSSSSPSSLVCLLQSCRFAVLLLLFILSSTLPSITLSFQISNRNAHIRSTLTQPPKQREQQQQQYFLPSSDVTFVRKINNNNRMMMMMSSTSSSSSMTTTPSPFPVRIAVMGGGNFGLAMASICARQGHITTILVREQSVADEINTHHRHPRYMQGIALPPRLRATIHPQECLPDATYIIHAVPCQYSRKFLQQDQVQEFMPPTTPVLSVSKGIETSSLGFMADLLKDCLGHDRPLAFLSGPSFAREIVEGVATAVVIASEDLDLARDLAALLSDGRFKCFTSTDVIGVEVGGAVKNVIALGAGMCEGLGLGTNAMSGLVTRGCNEMRRLGLTFGARPSTMAGLSGKKN